MSETILIIGASLAGLNAAKALRLDGFDGSIIVVDADPDRPYDRPPLSKQILTGEWGPERIGLAIADEDLDLDLRLGVRATGLDLDARTITTESTGGAIDTVAFDGLVIACGAAARRLPGTDGVSGVHVVRTLRDSLALREDLDSTPSRVVVVGAGFIGAEVAAACRKRELDVTIVEAMPLPLERILGAEIGAVCAEVHRTNGTDIRLGVGIDRIETVDDAGVRRVAGVTLTDGTAIDCEVLVVGIGVSVNVDWLDGSGLVLDDGVMCDDTLLAAPGVVACGDIARYPSTRFGQTLRIEHWETAIAGGAAAGRRILAELRGEPGEVFDPVPWFWSDQYDRKLQLAGRPAPGDSCEIVIGSTEEFRFVALFGRGDDLVGVFGMNRPRHVVQLRGLLESGASLAEARERAGTL